MEDRLFKWANEFPGERSFSYESDRATRSMVLRLEDRPPALVGGIKVAPYTCLTRFSIVALMQANADWFDNIVEEMIAGMITERERR